MSSEQEQLVQAITERVLAALRNGVEHSAAQPAADDPSNRGATSGAGDRRGQDGAARSGDSAHGETTPHAAIRPPIGVCTGDYSQFPELRRRPGSPAMPRRGGGGTGTGQTGRAEASRADRGSEQHRTPAPPVASSSSPSGGGSSAGTRNRDEPSNAVDVLSGIVTATRLDEAAGQTTEGVIRLAADAQLSPLAADRIKERGLRLQRAGTPAGDGTDGPTRSAGTWLWWIEGQCPAVRAVTEAMEPTLRSLHGAGQAGELTEAVAEMARRVRQHRAAGGVLFVPSAARAGCFANRCESLRAMVGTCEQAVAEGVDELGANVLIVEYAHHGREAMRRMVERFVCTPRPGTGAVDRELQELSRCV